MKGLITLVKSELHYQNEISALNRRLDALEGKIKEMDDALQKHLCYKFTNEEIIKLREM